MPPTINDQSPSLAPPTAPAPERVHLDGGEFGLLLPAADVVTLLPGKLLIVAAETASPLPAQTCDYVELEQQRYPVF